MAITRIVEMDYHDFMEKLREATDTGIRIEPREKEKWATYVTEKGIRDKSFMAIGRNKYENIIPVIINGGDWDGMYVYSKDEAAVLKWDIVS